MSIANSRSLAVTGVPSDHLYGFIVNVTVLSPLDQTGVLATLIDGTTSGVTPFTVQYSGRHISCWKVNALKTELVLDVLIGKIQFGTAPGVMAQVIVPACLAPVA